MYKIAIVEDEKNLAALVLKYLCTEGYEVKLYSNGEEALQDAEFAYDLWILDIMLPGIISGYDLIKKLERKIRQSLSFLLQQEIRILIKLWD